MSEHPSIEPPQYPNPPVTRVALDVRFPDPNPAGRMDTRAQHDLRDRLGDNWIVQNQQQAEVLLESGTGALSEPLRTVTVPVFLSRTQFYALAVGVGGLTLETTRFEGYPKFRAFAETVLEATSAVIAPEGVLRVGLRYIDELRGLTHERLRPREWMEWLHPSLVGPKVAAMEDLGYIARHWRGEIFFEVGERRGLTLHYEPRPGPIRYPNGPLLRPRPPDEGPWFLLDFDAFWSPSEIPSFDVNTLLEECDKLRDPMYALFELLTTEPLRDVFNGKGGERGGEDAGNRKTS